jgi:hypothetical protein
MLRLRVITAVVLLVALGAALWAGTTAFAAAMAILLGDSRSLREALICLLPVATGDER